MILLGITGPIAHGKSTLAEYLVAQDKTARQDESFRVIAQVTEKLNAKLRASSIPSASNTTAVNEWLAYLPHAINDVCGLGSSLDIQLAPDDIASRPDEYSKLWQYLDILKRKPSIIEQSITQANKEDYRPMLQWIGGYAVKHVNAGIWYNELVRRAKLAEAEGCNLFVIAGLRYPAEADIIHSAGGQVIKVVRPAAEQTDLSDPTERERENIVTDAIIYNDGTLKDLEHASLRLIKDIRQAELRPEYHAARN